MSATKQYAIELGDGSQIGPWPVTSKPDAREMARRELGVGRLPKGSAVVEVDEDAGPVMYEPPYRARLSPSGLVWQVVDVEGQVRATGSEAETRRKADLWTREETREAVAR